MHVGHMKISEQAHRQRDFAAGRQASLAAVYEPGEGVPSVEASAPTESPEAPPEQDHGQHPYHVFVRLIHLRCDTAAEKKKRNDLIAAVTQILLEAEEFERVVLAARREELTAEWKNLKKQCRAQLAVLTKARNAERNAEAAVQNCVEARHHALAQLQAVSSAKLPAYFSDAEAAARDSAIAEARAISKDVDQQMSYAIGDRFQAQQQLKEAEAKMDELGSAERRVRHALDGQQYFDAEFGLKV